jgi:prepilin-type N-terminal cleavage/methylation domain-containing protein
MRRRAFTLVELLVVIAVISILAGLLLPALDNALNQARSIACLNNLKQNGIAFSMYGNDANGKVAPLYGALTTGSLYFPSSNPTNSAYIRNDAINRRTPYGTGYLYDAYLDGQSLYCPNADKDNNLGWYDFDSTSGKNDTVSAGFKYHDVNGRTIKTNYYYNSVADSTFKAQAPASMTQDMYGRGVNSWMHRANRSTIDKCVKLARPQLWDVDICHKEASLSVSYWDGSATLWAEAPTYWAIGGVSVFYNRPGVDALIELRK